ncbi:hypothetical protein GCM10020000_26310 [Streptomyces olivoverticillatus]
MAAAVSRQQQPADAEPLRELGNWLTTHAEPLPDVIREEIDQILHGGAVDGPEDPGRPRRARSNCARPGAATWRPACPTNAPAPM